MEVQKRDGRTVEFNLDKITGAMRKAFLACQMAPDEMVLLQLTYEVCNQLGDVPSVSIESIQDAVEQVLMRHHPTVAKAYIIYREHRASIRGFKPDPNAIADYIHSSKYARYRPALQRRESFAETVARVEAMHMKKFPNLAREIEVAFDFVRNKKVLPSMRSMQFAGPSIEQHNARMYNCCYTLVDRPRVFGEILYLLLCGCGVGFSVQKQHVAKLPPLKVMDPTRVCHFPIPDNIEGWADALNLLITGAIEGFHIEFSYGLIRPVGSPLSSGGRAPGHLSLKENLEYIREVLLLAQGRHLRPIECYDIICFTADAVLSGGIRRSSCIALFSYDDEEMRHSKDPANFNFITKNYQRSLANNSVAFLRTEVTREQFMDVMDQNRRSYGEPGFVFLNDLDMGVNPCGEIILNPTTDHGTGFGFCNLVEVNAAAMKDRIDFHESCLAASFIATLQAAYTSFNYLGPESKEIAERDALIGVSITGIMDSPWIVDEGILNLGAKIVEEGNAKYAREIGIRPAARHTCIKPSGTASLELGCVASGIHPHHSKRYFRRVTANPNEPVAKLFRKVNPHMVEVKPNGDWCITFPVKTAGITLNDITQEEFLSTIIDVHQWWIRGHNISATMVVTDWNILESVWANRDKLSSMTFLPEMSDKGIPYCPREAVIDEHDIVVWGDLIRRYKPVDYNTLVEDADTTTLNQEAACSGGSCEIERHVDVPMGRQVFLGTHLVGDRTGRFTIVEANGTFSVGVWT